MHTNAMKTLSKDGTLIWCIALLLCSTIYARTEEYQLYSKWDASLFDIVLSNVDVKVDYARSVSEPSVVTAWRQIQTKYLLRANLYVDMRGRGGVQSNSFSFLKESATGKEICDAFLGAYPSYTFTRDRTTGVLWFHPKAVPCDSILAERVEIAHPELQLRMLTEVLEPLFIVAYPNPRVWVDPSGGARIGSYSVDQRFINFETPVDLPGGVCTVRDVVNYCCASCPTIAFMARVENGQQVSRLVPVRLDHFNLARERPAAVRFWQTEIGAATNAPPSPTEIVGALSSPSPRVRWAAREYARATRGLSHGLEMADSRLELWQSLGWKAILRAGLEDEPFVSQARVLATNRLEVMRNISSIDAGLALLVCMELARETKDSTIIDVLSDHNLTEAEVATIKPELYRIARESAAVREKLIKMKFSAPALSPEALMDLGNTNLFKRVLPQSR